MLHHNADSQMKPILSCLAISGLYFLTLLATPQTANVSLKNRLQPFMPGFMSVSAGATSNSVAMVNTLFFQSLSLQASFAMSAATSSNVVFSFSRSIDGLNWDSPTAWSVPANGTNVVSSMTNLTVNGAAWVRLSSVQNTSPAALSGLLVSGYSKGPF